MWKKDNTWFGLGLGLASLLITSLLIAGIFLVLNLPVMLYQKYFLLATLPGLFLFRQYMKKWDCPKTAKGFLLVLVVFITGFIIYLVKEGHILANSEMIKM